MGLGRFFLTFGNLLLRSGRVKSHRTPEAPDLAQEVRHLLNLHRGQWKAIAPSSGVSYSWLSKFARGCIENPGYATLRRVQTLLRANEEQPPSELGPRMHSLFNKLGAALSGGGDSAWVDAQNELQDLIDEGRDSLRRPGG